MDATETRHALESIHDSSFGWALHCCGGDPLIAEDVLQAAYVKVLRGAASKLDGGGRASFKTWFFGVVRNTAREERRRAWRRIALLERLLTRDAPQPCATPTRPDEHSQSAERRLQIAALLDKLSPRQRDALHLVFYQGLTLDEAAMAMGISPGSARTHYERGKARLRTLLESKRHLDE